jgi:hypothetical protein
LKRAGGRFGKVVSQGVAQIGYLALLAGVAEGGAVVAAAGEAAVVAATVCGALKFAKNGCAIEATLFDIGERYLKDATVFPIVRVRDDTGIPYVVPGHWEGLLRLAASPGPSPMCRAQRR